MPVQPGLVVISTRRLDVRPYSDTCRSCELVEVVEVGEAVRTGLDGVSAAAARRVEDAVLAVRTRQRYEQIQALRGGQGHQADHARDRPGQGDRPPLLPRRHRPRAARKDQGRSAAAPRPPQALPAPAVERGLHERTSASCTPSCASAASRAATAPSAITCCRFASRGPLRPHCRARPRSATSPSESSPACTATVSTTGSPPLRPTTSPTCTPSPGIKRDHQAVLNGLAIPWSSGVVEGNVNKILKRQTYGRASFELLRKRVLLCQ
jgi:hypothetical protein